MDEGIINSAGHVSKHPSTVTSPFVITENINAPFVLSKGNSSRLFTIPSPSLSLVGFNGNSSSVSMTPSPSASVSALSPIPSPSVSNDSEERKGKESIPSANPSPSSSPSLLSVTPSPSVSQSLDCGRKLACPLFTVIPAPGQLLLPSQKRMKQSVQL